MVGPKAFDFYALSWDVPRKPACNVVETAQRKSQAVAPDPKVFEPKPEEREKTHAGDEGKTAVELSERFLNFLGLTPGGESWEAALNGKGHHKDGLASYSGLPCRL